MKRRQYLVAVVLYFDQYLVHAMKRRQCLFPVVVNYSQYPVQVRIDYLSPCAHLCLVVVNYGQYLTTTVIHNSYYYVNNSYIISTVPAQ